LLLLFFFSFFLVSPFYLFLFTLQEQNTIKNPSR